MFLGQYLLQDKFIQLTTEKIKNLKSVSAISQDPYIQKQTQMSKEAFKNLLQDLKKIVQDTSILRTLNERALNILSSNGKKEEFIQATLEVQEEFRKYGIKVFPEVPGRVRKEWQKTSNK